MIFAAFIWAMAQAAFTVEAAIDVVVPDSWLGIIRSALNGWGTALVKAALYRLDDTTVAVIAATVDIGFLLFFATVTIRAVRRIKSFVRK